MIGCPKIFDMSPLRLVAAATFRIQPTKCSLTSMGIARITLYCWRRSSLQLALTALPRLSTSARPTRFRKLDPLAFNHVITYLPSLDLYVDSTAQFAPFGILPFGDTDKPVALTSLGRLGRTPRMRADVNVSRTKVSMVIHSDGTIEGTSTATMSGDLRDIFEIRAIQ